MDKALKKVNRAFTAARTDNKTSRALPLYLIQIRSKVLQLRLSANQSPCKGSLKRLSFELCQPQDRLRQRRRDWLPGLANNNSRYPRINLSVSHDGMAGVLYCSEWRRGVQEYRLADFRLRELHSWKRTPRTF